MADGHNRSVIRRNVLTLSEESRPTLRVIDGGKCSRRLCAPCVTRRHHELKRGARARVTPAVVAETIARRGVWAAVVEHGISYEHALRIRRRELARLEAERDPEIVTESELRLLWGDR